MSDELDVTLTGWAEPVFAGEFSDEFVARLEEAESNRRGAGPRKAASGRDEPAVPSLRRAGAEDRAEEGGGHRRDLARDRRPGHAYAGAHRAGDVGGARRPRHPSVPVEPRPGRVPRGGRAASTRALRGRRSTRTAEVMPAIGGKECIFNLNLAFLDEGDVALAADPGYPVYTGGPLLAGAEPVLMPLVPERGFAPDLAAIPEDELAARPADVPQLPEQPDRRGRARTGFFEEVVAFAREHDILVVHDNAYSELTFDGYVAPSFLATPGAMDVGVEVFSLSKSYNMTGWRCGGDRRQRRGGRALLAAQDERRLGAFRGDPARRGRGAHGPAGKRRARCPRSTAPARPRARRAARDRDRARAAEGHDLHLGAGAGGPDLGRVRRRGARARRGRRQPGLGVRPERRGLLPDLAHRSRRAPARGGGADARQPSVADAALDCGLGWRQGRPRIVPVDRTKADRAKQTRYGEKAAGIVNPRARQRALCVAVLAPPAVKRTSTTISRS